MTKLLIKNTLILVPILEYFQEPEVQEKMEEVGRIIWSNNSISINLGAVIALGLLALALLGGLLFLLFAGDGGGETAGYGYGYEQTDYGYGGDFAQRSVSLGEVINQRIIIKCLDFIFGYNKILKTYFVG